MKIAAVIVAAGRGTRAGAGDPKQWRPLAGRSSAQHAMQVFADHARIDRLVLVLHPDDLAAGNWPAQPAADIVSGGATRSASVLAGLRVLEGACDRVLIHDAARPCVSAQVIDGVLAGLEQTPAAAPGVPVVDALWRGENGQVAGMVDRDNLFRAQTPQGFHFDSILAAHRAFPDGATDDVALAQRAKLPVTITPGSEDNLKITLPEDFARAERILRERHGHQAG
ncbi:2-C-methyl-D-erythritol 4-phosphate cytidylyltransferase [Roseobacter sp. YSTF-M11]|uniref:2-C-methyl-D-erythritol 4-phosphate cytidylyltransferase n=1 Tax=Roseobacter insulae TaxID=2859783 RepID=A0A9X1FXG3_9RHOB|nr:2-C-methyl-D-erythritol 4-phosphate cytidylyltransferase [Roseobacter insulae]MBW4708820.1 2-C-methyl-D-erythritol 4-phosphate cytidylyltransferase [Roseobacter insulae]